MGNYKILINYIIYTQKNYWFYAFFVVFENCILKNFDSKVFIRQT